MGLANEKYRTIFNKLCTYETLKQQNDYFIDDYMLTDKREQVYPPSYITWFIVGGIAIGSLVGFSIFQIVKKFVIKKN